jgi:hypothetical protein
MIMNKSTKIVGTVGLAGLLYLWYTRGQKQKAAVAAARKAAAVSKISDGGGAGDGSLSGATLSHHVFAAKRGMGSLG